MQEDKKYGVFISYSHDDAQLVLPVVQLVSSMREDLVFLDTKDLLPGKKWEPQLLSALDESAIVIVFWCQHSEKSENVRKELKQAIAAGKDIIPLLLDSTALDSALKDYQWIDFRYTMNHQFWKVEKMEDISSAIDYFKITGRTDSLHVNSVKKPLTGLIVLVRTLAGVVGIVYFWEASRPFYLNIVVMLSFLILMHVLYVLIIGFIRRFSKNKKRITTIDRVAYNYHNSDNHFQLYTNDAHVHFDHTMLAKSIIDKLSEKIPVR